MLSLRAIAAWFGLSRPGARGRAAGERRLGAMGEAAAAKALRRAGYRVLRRNVKIAAGEIDLIALAPDRRTIVFVEVKTRMRAPGDDGPPPEASVGARKRAKLRTLAGSIARRAGWEDRPLRIDVIGVEYASGVGGAARGPAALRHHPGVVEG